MRASRLGAVVTVLLVMALDLPLAGRYRLAPQWVATSFGAALVLFMIGGRYARNLRLARVEDALTIFCIIAALLLNAANLIAVVEDVLFHPEEIEPTPLILSSLAIWSANLLSFSLLYWAIDRGGPDARIGPSPGYPDFDFPAYARSEQVAPGWRPNFVDYLFIGFTTSTAFSPTEAMPLTPRAKGLMIFQSLISLVTVIVVAARAIGIIPSG
jgi:hypothetical protein